MTYFIGGRVRTSDESKKVEMEDQLLEEREKNTRQTVVLKVSSLSLYDKLLVLSYLIKVPENGKDCPEFVRKFLDDHLHEYLTYPFANGCF